MQYATYLRDASNALFESLFFLFRILLMQYASQYPSLACTRYDADADRPGDDVGALCSLIHLYMHSQAAEFRVNNAQQEDGPLSHT